MDTWEVVLILVLLTISISIIANRDVPLSLISLLDNTYFQLAILGLTLGVAIVSPPVAIVAIATIVTVYYIRNLVKIQMVSINRKIDKENEEQLDEPRIEISEEIKVVKNTSIIANKDTIEAALREHEQPVPQEGNAIMRTSNNSKENSDIEENHPQLTIPDPRKSQTEVESFDTNANFNSSPNGQSLSSIDSDVFKSSNNIDSANEPIGISSSIRAYNDSVGQYDIHESRPSTSVERYDQVDFMPMGDMGENKFEPIGVSIDDKNHKAKQGLMPSSNPPANFNEVMPPRAH